MTPRMIRSDIKLDADIDAFHEAVCAEIEKTFARDEVVRPMYVLDDGLHWVWWDDEGQWEDAHAIASVLVVWHARFYAKTALINNTASVLTLGRDGTLRSTHWPIRMTASEHMFLGPRVDDASIGPEHTNLFNRMGHDDDVELAIQGSLK